MKTIEIKGTEYTAAIDGSDIVLDSLNDRIIFEGGGDKIEKEAEEAYYKTRRDLAKWNPSEFEAFDNYSKDAWIEEYIDEKIIEWCKENLALGKIETYNLN